MKNDITKNRRVSTFLAAGEKLFNGYRYKEAIVEGRKAAALDKDNPAAAELIAKAENILVWIEKLRGQAANFRNKGERLRAAMLYAEILKLDPTLPDIGFEAKRLEQELKTIDTRIETGESLFLRHEYGGAIAEWKEVIKLDRENPEAVFLIKKANDVLARTEGLREKAREYRRSGRLDPAARTYEELLRLFPNLAEARKELEEVNTEIRRANALRARQLEEHGNAPRETKSAGAGERAAIETKVAGLKNGRPQTRLAYILAALLLLIFASLFNFLTLMFSAPSSGALLAVSAVLAFSLLSLLLFLLFVFSAD